MFTHALNEKSELLRFSTSGSVDDGKSTLIGRLLYDTKLIFEDTLESLQRSADITGEGTINLANLTDGLRAEREQGITIDVAYRYFATPNRKFIVADTPGHIQYTRNMITGASTANLSIILVDARQGVVEQTRRHAYIASMLRIPHLVVCINKMDLMGYAEETFNKIREDFMEFATRLHIQDITFIPVSALNGDNIVERSDKMPWYQGAPLLRHMEEVYIGTDLDLSDPRFPVQYVVRPRDDKYHDFRGLAGQITGGVFKVGDPVKVLPSGKTSTIVGIHTYEGPVEQAFNPMSVQLLLADDLDISRGDMLVRPDNLPYVGTDFEARVCWMSEEPLTPNRKYVIRHTTRMTRCMVREIKSRFDFNTLLPQRPAPQLALNDIGRITIKTMVPLCYDPYSRNRYTGSFILVDEATNATVAAGMIQDPPKAAPGTDEAEYII
ncbi:MAG TPA: GTP-binding protein [Kiritimatiellia bacterium]|nr:GTP-binding protein [Kiritimatiellia bacterium]